MPTIPLSRHAPTARRSTRPMLLPPLMAALLAACGGGAPTSPREPAGPEIAGIVAAAYAPGASVTPAGATVPVGATVQLTAVDAAGRTVGGAGWSSSDPGVAAVGADGLVTAGVPGAATITATYRNRGASAQITVTAPPPPPVGTAIAPGEECPAGMTEVRPGNCRAPEMPAPSILDYRPRSTLVAPAHTVPRAKYPAIDFHVHAGGLTTADAYEQLIRLMDTIGMGVIVNMNGGTGDTLDSRSGGSGSPATSRWSASEVTVRPPTCWSW